MIIPVRCFSCGKPIAKDWGEYTERVSAGEDPQEVLDSLGHKRYCCRRMFVSHSELVDDVVKYRRLQ